MVRVFIFGATGFIGSPIATALRRTGHQVYGLARTPAKAKELLPQGIHPVHGTIEDTSTWLPLVDSSIDIVIDSSSSGSGVSDAIIDGLLSIPRVKNYKPGSSDPRLGFIYISGTWLHGNTPERTTDLIRVGAEKSPQPPSIVAWRTELENRILLLREKNVDCLILRPAILFGSTGSLFNFWWGPIASAFAKNEPSVSLEAIPANRVGLISQTDIGEAALNAVDRFEVLANTLPYPVFNIVGATESVGELITAAAERIGYKGKIEYIAPTNPLLVAMSTAQNLDTRRAKTYLGWEPYHTTVVGEIDLYVKSFLAGLQQ